MLYTILQFVLLGHTYAFPNHFTHDKTITEIAREAVLNGDENGHSKMDFEKVDATMKKKVSVLSKVVNTPIIPLGNGKGAVSLKLFGKTLKTVLGSVSGATTVSEWHRDRAQLRAMKDRWLKNGAELCRFFASFNRDLQFIDISSEYARRVVDRLENAGVVERNLGVHPCKISLNELTKRARAKLRLKTTRGNTIQGRFTGLANNFKIIRPDDQSKMTVEMSDGNTKYASIRGGHTSDSNTKYKCEVKGLIAVGTEDSKQPGTEEQDGQDRTAENSALPGGLPLEGLLEFADSANPNILPA